jgi:hypothetical protein
MSTVAGGTIDQPARTVVAATSMSSAIGGRTRDRYRARCRILMISRP